MGHPRGFGMEPYPRFRLARAQAGRISTVTNQPRGFFMPAAQPPDDLAAQIDREHDARFHPVLDALVHELGLGEPPLPDPQAALLDSMTADRVLEIVSTTCQPLLPPPVVQPTPILDAWRREPHRRDWLWRAACWEQAALIAERLGQADVAHNARQQVLKIVQAEQARR
jgi:hypothetical protein